VYQAETLGVERNHFLFQFREPRCGFLVSGPRHLGLAASQANAYAWWLFLFEVSFQLLHIAPQRNEGAICESSAFCDLDTPTSIAESPA
jgi:hypothetical protein